MERLMHETRETFMSLLVVSCLVAGIGGAVFYTLGPDGWLSGLVRQILQDPNLASLASLASVIAVLALVMRWLDKKPRSGLNNLLVGVVALGGFAVILQGIRSVLG
jgi:hypothetical protein